MVERSIGTFTFLFTDVEGSSTLWEQAPEAMHDALARHDTLLREAVADHGGAVFKSLGDGLAAVFDDVIGAVTAAITAQRALRSELWDSAAPLRVRMALLTGPARPRDGDYYGQSVNRVARLVNFAVGGQILLAESTAAVVGPHLSSGVALHCIGERHLRGMLRPETVFEAVLVDDAGRGTSTDDDSRVAETDITGERSDAQATGPTMFAPFAAAKVEPVDTPFIPAYPFPTPERLIGRAAQLKRLTEVLRLGQESGQVVLISAPAGTGKSTLVGALVQQARRAGILCLVGGGYEEEGADPLGPFREALADYLLAQTGPRLVAELGGLLDELAFVIPELRQHLALAETPALTAPPDPHRMFAVVHACLRRLTEQQPVLLCIEDLHAVGSTSLVLLRFLARQMRRQPIVILATYRSDEVQPGQPLADLVISLRREEAQLIDLPPLSQEQTNALVTALLAGPPSEELGETLYRSTEGNPLFVEQLLLALREDGWLDRQGDTWYQRGTGSGTVPTIVRDVIGRRLGRLSDAVRETLALAAVLGQTIDHEVLLATSTHQDEVLLLDELDEAFRAHILQETPSGWAFAHALLREVVYTGLSAPRRMLLHTRVGEALEQLAGSKASERAAELAHHFYLGGRSKAMREKALQYSLQAGRRAAALSALREAVEHFVRACALVNELGDAVELTVRLDALEGHGRAACGAGAWRQCTDSHRELLTICTDPLRRARARNDIARALSSIGQTADAMVECNAGLAELETAEDGPETIAVRLGLQYHLALMHFLAGRFGQLRALANEMLGAAQQLDEPTYLNIAHSVMAWSYMALDHVDAALEQFRLALDTGARIGNRERMAVACVNLGIQNYRGARFAAARPELERAITLFRENAGDVRAINGIQILSRNWLAQGDLDRAETQARLVETIVANGEHRWAAECHDLRGTILAARAQWEAAESSFREAIRIRQQVGHMAGLVESLLGLGLVYERRGDWLEATNAYSRALDVAQRMDPSPQHMAAERQCGRLLLRRGLTIDGAEHVRAACALGETMPQSLEYAPTLLVGAELALHDAPDDAVVLAERVLALGSTLEVRIEAHALLVKAHVALGEPDRAEMHADAAVDLATRFGTPYPLGLAHLARAQAASAAGRPAAEVEAATALEHFSVAAMPYERASALLTYAKLVERRRLEDERTQKMRLEADRLLSALVV